MLHKLTAKPSCHNWARVAMMAFVLSTTTHTSIASGDIIHRNDGFGTAGNFIFTTSGTGTCVLNSGMGNAAINAETFTDADCGPAFFKAKTFDAGNNVNLANSTSYHFGAGSLIGLVNTSVQSIKFQILCSSGSPVIFANAGCYPASCTAEGVCTTSSGSKTATLP